MTPTKSLLVWAAALLALPLGAGAAVTQVEGAAGGGIVPWALLSSGKPTASATWVNTGDYNLTSVAVQGTLMDRVELSYAYQSFDLGGHYASDLVRSLGHDEGAVGIDVIGAKVKLLDMSDGLPALAVGIQHKRTDLDDNVLSTIGSNEDSGTDVYLAATKVLPLGGKNVLLNGTLRATKANQIGILGFGGTGANDDDYSVQFEGTLGVFAAKDTVVGVEYRSKPDNLNNYKEEDWWDLFVAYMPSENWSLVGAYADLGDIIAEASDASAGSAVAEGEAQRGIYLQIQANF